MMPNIPVNPDPRKRGSLLTRIGYVHPSASQMNALKGAAVALVSAFFVALLFAYTFRVPIPLLGMLGPFGEFSPYASSFKETITSVLIAWVAYGFLGGFFILPIFGAIAGRSAGRRYSAAKNKNLMIVAYAGLASAIPVVGLCVLDYVIGPW